MDIILNKHREQQRWRAWQKESAGEDPRDNTRNRGRGGGALTLFKLFESQLITDEIVAASIFKTNKWWALVSGEGGEGRSGSQVSIQDRRP